jgi:hypothetical protein
MGNDPVSPQLGKHGGLRVKGQRCADVTLVMRGNSRAYIEARLIRDGRADLIRAIKERRLSHFGAGVVAGYHRRPRRVFDERPQRPAALDPRALIG